MRQKTLAKEVEFKGIGLHTGEKARVRVLPAREEQGILFKRVDLAPEISLGTEDIAPDPGYGRTSLAKGEVKLDTIEHLSAALYGVGISNATVEVDGPEIPGGDGSALVFAKALAEAGSEEQDAEEPVFTPLAAVSVSGGNARLAFLPGGHDLSIRFTTEYGPSSLASAHAEFKIDARTFVEEIAPARTFCMKEDVEPLLKAGVGKGATLDNTLVIDGDHVEGNELRFPDEPLRHKVLDLLGDLSLLGMRLCGRAVGVRSGHALNRMLLAKLRACRNGTAAGASIDTTGIQRDLPHRYPFLLVDRVVELEEGKRIVAVKNVTRSEEYFQGHFPGEPVMPGVLQLEALAQAAGVLLSEHFKGSGGVAALVGLDEARFRRPVYPGDVLVLTVQVKRLSPRRNLSIVQGEATVDGELASEARLLFALMRREGER